LLLTGFRYVGFLLHVILFVRDCRQHRSSYMITHFGKTNLKPASEIRSMAKCRNFSITTVETLDFSLHSAASFSLFDSCRPELDGPSRIFSTIGWLIIYGCFRPRFS